MKARDLTGLRIGMLTVVAPTERRVRNAVVWRCRCDCGNTVELESRRLKPGVVYSCGCTPAPQAAGKDLTGQRFGKLVVLGKSGNKAPDRNPLWLCRCDCGNTVETTKHKLVSGGIRSCGCGRTPPLKDFVGKRFGMLTVLSYAGRQNNFHLWHCRCDCGNETDVRQSNLQNGWTTSCGCRRDPTQNFHYVAGTCVELLDTSRMYRSNTSGVRGVYYSSKRGKWVAQIVFRQKRYCLGSYSKLEDAAKARALAEEKLFGDFLSWYAEAHPQKPAAEAAEADEAVGPQPASRKDPA